MAKADNKPAFVKRDTIITGNEYAQLYAKYNLSAEEIAFIESMIKPMLIK